MGVQIIMGDAEDRLAQYRVPSKAQETRKNQNMVWGKPPHTAHNIYRPPYISSKNIHFQEGWIEGAEIKRGDSRR